MKGKSERFNSITNSFKFITSILSWVVLVILVLIAAFLLYYFVSMKVYAQKGEQYRPIVSLYNILTPSMVPNINPDDVVIDIRVDKPSDIKIGDVITFVSTASLTKGMTITHRVIDIKVENKETLYYTKGDANLPADGAPARFSNVLGKVVLRIPMLGKLQHFLATRGGWLIVVVIPALIVIISDILKIFRLQTAKNQVNSTIATENMKKKQEQKQKEQIEEKLMNRYNVKNNDEKNENVILKEEVANSNQEHKKDKVQKPKKKNSKAKNRKTEMNVKSKEHSISDMPARVSKNDLPKRIDLPKLKTDNTDSEKK